MEVLGARERRQRVVRGMVEVEGLFVDDDQGVLLV